MRLNVLSDLHLSRGSLPHPTVSADVVVLAGDIVRPAQAIEWARGLGKPTLYVPGNHEFYGSSLPETVRELEQLAAGSQVRVLDDGEWTFGNVRFFSATWLESRLRTPWPGPTVVITHHAPSERSVDPRFEGSPLNVCFASHLDHLLQGELACTWIHGHVHHSVDYQAGGTRVVCNPRAYARDGRNENPDFDIDFVVDIE